MSDAMSGSENHWKQIESLFHGALEQPESQRRAWLARQVGEDLELLNQVLNLLDLADDHETVLKSVVGRAAVDLSSSTAPINRRLGPYRIVRQLGRGGMGEVYLAERDDKEYHQRVAIKVIRGFSGQNALERFRRERQILADLQHPHIARLLDGGTTAEGQPYLVMDFVDGLPLRQWCSERQPSRQQRLRLMLRVFDAIHYAHQHLIIHRDIKPGNILVNRFGEPVVVDFGIARLLDDQEPESSQGAPGYTPGFASPEQKAGRAVTTASDIYSLGRLLLTLLTDSKPSSKRQSQAQDELTGQQDALHRLPGDLAAIIGKATRNEPNERYDSVAELRTDLIRFLDGKPVRAIASSPAYRLGKFVRRNRPGLVIAGLALLVLTAIGWRWLETHQRALQAESRALAEAVHAEQVLNVLLDAISAAAPGQSRGQAVTVRQVLDQSYARLNEQMTIDVEARDRLLLSLGEVYLRLEEHDKAEELLNRVGASSSPMVSVRALSLMGHSLVLRKRANEAGVMLNAALAGVEQHREALSVAVIREARNHHALWMREAGQPQAAGAVFAELVQANLDADQPELAARMLHNLALAESDQGHWSRAVEHLRRSLALKEQTIGRLHPSYALSLSILAQNLVRLGEYEAAQDALTESLTLRVRLFGDDHTGLHYDYNELGSMHHDQGDFQRAIELYQRAITLREQSGEPPISAVSYLNNLAFAYEDRGDWQRAEPLYRQSLAIRQDEYGPEHASVAHARHNLARLLIRLGSLEEAEQLAEQVIDFRVGHFGHEHHATAYSRSLLGMLAHARGDLASARVILEHSLATLMDALPATNGWVLTTRGLLARVLVDAGALVDSESLLTGLLEDYQAAFRPDHPGAAVLEIELARVELATDRQDQAISRLNRVSETISQSLAPDSLPHRQLQCLRSGQLAQHCGSMGLN